MELTQRLEELRSRLTAYIIKTAPVTMDTLIAKATKQGYTELEVLNALDGVHRDKRITQTANTAGVVTYKLAAVKERVDTGAWLREHYPWPDHFEMPFPDVDFSFIFMTRDEATEYKATAKGVPTFMYNKRNVKEKR